MFFFFLFSMTAAIRGYEAEGRNIGIAVDKINVKGLYARQHALAFMLFDPGTPLAFINAK